MSNNDLNTRCTAALRALEGAGVIKSAWLPGMLNGADGTRYVGRDNFAWEDPYRYHASGIGPMDVPDLSDPVTAASLIVLVREAWGDNGAHSKCLLRRYDGLPQWHVRANDSHFAACAEAGALVAALEAKVREVTRG